MATNENASQNTAEKTGSSLLAKLQILAVVTAIVLGECLAAYWYLPSPAETAAMAGGTLGINQSVDAEEETAEEDFFDDSELGDQVEVDLGEFSVTSFQPISNTTLRIDFHLFGTVAADDRAGISHPDRRKRPPFSRTGHCDGSRQRHQRPHRRRIGVA